MKERRVASPKSDTSLEISFTSNPLSPQSVNSDLALKGSPYQDISDYDLKDYMAMSPGKLLNK